jgi:hypothetical protein
MTKKNSCLVLVVTLSMLFSSPVFAQISAGQVIKGQVLDEITKFPIKGATVSVLIDSTTKSSITDEKVFSL